MRDHPYRQRPRLTAEFIAAVRASAHTCITLSALVGYPGSAPLSAILLRRSISSTPLGLERIVKVADVIGYTGDLFIGKAATS